MINDAGILIERGSTGDNGIIAWDESGQQIYSWYYNCNSRFNW